MCEQTHYVLSPWFTVHGDKRHLSQQLLLCLQESGEFQRTHKHAHITLLCGGAWCIVYCKTIVYGWFTVLGNASGVIFCHFNY